MHVCYQEERSMKKENDFSIPLMAFTFFYAVAIYLLLIGFHFWHWHLKDKAVQQ